MTLNFVKENAIAGAAARSSRAYAIQACCFADFQLTETALVNLVLMNTFSFPKFERRKGISNWIVVDA